MHINEEKKIYTETDKYIDIQQNLQEGIQFKLFVEFPGEKFVDYQKDLIQEFTANFIDDIQNNEYDGEAIKLKCETGLQDLNTKLKAFADKVRDVEYFEMKGYIQIVL